MNVVSSGISSLCANLPGLKKLIQSYETQSGDAYHDFESFSLTADYSRSGYSYETVATFRGIEHDFSVDNGSFESLIPKHHLTNFYPENNIRPSSLTGRGNTGYSIPVLGTNHYSHF